MHAYLLTAIIVLTQLGHVLRGTHKWIGATECCALLRSFNIDARVVDFCGQEKDGGEPHAALADWVWRYFSRAVAAEAPASGAAAAAAAAGVDAPSLALCDAPPLYFQHDGHSRTIVGAEKRWARGACTVCGPLT